jgi:hypothetical protein
MLNATTTTPAVDPVSAPIAATPAAGSHRQKGPAMRRFPARLLILALGVALLGSTLAAAPAQAQSPPPIPRPPIPLPSLPPIGIPPSQIPPLPPNGVPPIGTPVQQPVCASLAAGQPASVRDQLLAQAGCPPVAADDFWGIHQNGWHVCVRNATNLPLRWVDGLFTDNVAVPIAGVDAHGESCALRGAASWFGGPADMNFRFYSPYGTLQRPRQANVTVGLNAWTHNNSIVLDMGCGTWETYDDPPLLKCSVDTFDFSVNQPIIVTVEYR